MFPCELCELSKNIFSHRTPPVFSCEFCESSKNTFSCRTPPVAASVLKRKNNLVWLPCLVVNTSVVKEVKKPDNVSKTVKKRTLQIETAEKWKTTSLVQYDVIQPKNNNKKLVKTMHCKLCREYKNEICWLPQFNYTWSKDGVVRLQLLAATEHGTKI